MGMSDWEVQYELGRDAKRAEDRVKVLEQALRELLQYLDDHDWGTIPEGETADRARSALGKGTD